MTDENKGRATPSRKDAEAARRAQMKPAVTRKERVKRDRARIDKQRLAQREALRTGKGPNLPIRDQGPVRAFVRDYVDGRWTVNEFLLPILIITLLISFAATTTSAVLTMVIYATTFALVVLDSLRLRHGLKKALRAEFDESQLRGDVFYGFVRSTQMRFLRLPKPTTKR